MNGSNISRVSQLKDGIAYGELELRKIIATALLAACLCTGSRAAHSGEAQTPRPDAVDAPALQIGFEHGVLSLAAHRVPWKRVLDQITQKTGIRFRYTAPPKGTLSISIQPPLPAEQVLRRILGPGSDFICRYGRPSASGETHGLPQEVWILERDRFQTMESVSPESRRSINGSSFLTHQSVNVDTEPVAEATEAYVDNAGVGNEADALLELARDNDPALRAHALSALADPGTADDETILGTLEAGLADQDASVRGRALQILVDRGGSEQMKYLWQALGDSDPSVRLMAVESVASTNDGIALLEQALADTEMRVRSLAAARLQQHDALVGEGHM